jgi:lysozyme family protein
MADFNLYKPKEFALEGTVYENDPNDTAGSTKFGLTTSDLHEYGLDANSDGKIDWMDVRDLSAEDAAKVLKKLYWDFFQADRINNQSLAEFISDAGLNQGRILIAKYVQNILHSTVDGIIGDRTIASINTHPNPQYIFTELYNKRKKRYDTIIANNPSQEVFRKGWYNRLNAIKFVP